GHRQGLCQFDPDEAGSREPGAGRDPRSPSRTRPCPEAVDELLAGGLGSECSRRRVGTDENLRGGTRGGDRSRLTRERAQHGRSLEKGEKLRSQAYRFLKAGSRGQVLEEGAQPHLLTLDDVVSGVVRRAEELPVRVDESAAF